MKIISRIKGGLGNQLFQLAFAFKFSSLNNLPIIFDASSYLRDKFGRRLLINQLDPELKFISNDFIQKLKLKNNYYINESDFDLKNRDINSLVVNKNLLSQKEYIILNGYWQDSRIIDKNISKYIKISILNYLKASNAKEIFDIISDTKNAIAIHIRRSDYAHHGLVDENVYLDFAEQILTKIPDGKIFIFSDEPNYANYLFSKERIPIRVVNSGNEIIDLALMSLCKIFMIANSSFSFWGAFLSDYTNVFYPEPWSHIHKESRFLFPTDWIKLPETVKIFKRESLIKIQF